jgi:thiol-disulfide isomerase/thioredoxin
MSQSKIQKTIISYFQSRDHFISLLEKNPGLVIIKMGASWCGPCKKIKPIVDAFFASSQDNVICCEITNPDKNYTDKPNDDMDHGK